MSEELESLREYDRSAPPAADPAVRARAKQLFLHGRPRRRRPRPSIWWSVAAAAAMFVIWFGAQPAEDWTIRAIEGQLHVDGEPAVVGQTLRSGNMVSGEASEIEFALGDRLLLRLRAGTDIQLPSPPGRWWGKSRALDLASGEVYGSTPGPLGFDLHLRTTEARAVLVGTTFAMFRRGDATCYCLYDGKLAIWDLDGNPVDLPVRRRVFLYADGRAPSIEELPFEENMKLQMIHDVVHPPDE